MTKIVLKPWVTALVVLTLAGCRPGSTSTTGTAPNSAAGGAGSSDAVKAGATPPVVDAAANKAATVAEAGRLLKLALVPPGAVATRTTPSSSSGLLADPAVGVPGTGSLVDLPRMWQVNMSFDQTNAWLTAHPPAGLRVFESAGPGGEPRIAGNGYQAADSPAWVNAELELSTAELTATSTLIRADGEAIWLDPEPLRDTLPGQRLRLTVRGGCPADDKRMVGVRNSGSDLKAALLPAAAPTAALICRYVGANGDSFALSRTTHLDQVQAAQLADEARQIRLSHVDDEVRHCPFDDGKATVIALSYPGRPDVDLWDNTNGCTSVTNGFIVAQGDLSTAVT
jgi:hypothetical protein